MGDPYHELSAAESKRADELAFYATQVGETALANTTITAARVAIEAAQKSGADELLTLAALRGDYRLLRDIDKDMAVAERKALALVNAAMLDGYEMDLRGRSSAFASLAQGVSFRVEITDADKRTLAQWPCQGHQPPQAVNYLINVLRYAVDGALVQSAVAVGDPVANMPAALADVARLHGARLGSLVAEAFFAAVQKATRDLRKARVA